MKKAIVLFVFMGTMFCSIAQETPPDTPDPVLTKEEYQKKSKRQLTGAIVMISAGGVMAVSGIFVVVSNADFGFGTQVDNNKHEALSATLIIVGTAAMLGSIGLFKSSSRNKRKALSISYKNEPALQLQKSMVFYRSVPSLNLKIQL